MSSIKLHITPTAPKPTKSTLMGSEGACMWWREIKCDQKPRHQTIKSIKHFQMNTKVTIEEGTKDTLHTENFLEIERCQMAPEWRRR
jgi:hypothetical protein